MERITLRLPATLHERVKARSRERGVSLNAEIILALEDGEPMSNLTKINTGTLIAGGRPAPIIPQTIDDAYRLAKAVHVSGLAPPGFKTAEQIMIAIMHGQEIGLTPLQSLQRLAVINNRVTIWGDGALGLVRGSGLCEYVTEFLEEEAGDKRRAVCQVRRKGERHQIERTFSIADAKKAGLWGKSGPWTQYPDRMLQMRARAFALRDGFADVLGGLYLREEMDDPPKPGAVTTTAAPFMEADATPQLTDQSGADEPELPIDSPGHITTHPDYVAGVRDATAGRHEPHFEIGEDEARWALWRKGYFSVVDPEREER